jgi:glycosyltransferase involved in cell wall biosynthesis
MFDKINKQYYKMVEENVEIDNIYCINLKHRLDRKENMQKQIQKYNLPVTFVEVTKHSNPKIGCMESHVSIIKLAMKLNLPYVVIFEDDCEFIKTPNVLDGKLILENPPQGWRMLYLGGCVNTVNDNTNENWKLVSTWLAHSYVIRSNIYELIITLADQYSGVKEIDEIYCELINPKYDSYITYPLLTEQYTSDSDIQTKNTDRTAETENFEDIIKEMNNINKRIVDKSSNVNKLDNTANESYMLNDNELPNISIITPTYNRRNTFKLAIYNFLNCNYPKDKIEWIIIDDGTDKIIDMIPTEYNIRYYYFDQNDKQLLYNKCISKINNNTNNKKNKNKNKNNNKFIELHKNKFFNNRIPIGLKRNIANSYTTSNYIIHMDDDDYYPTNSIRKRISLLLKPNTHCIACTTIPCFNINKYVSIMNSPPHNLPLQLRISEGTLCYTKQFWNKQKYNNLSIGSEADEFLKHRTELCTEIDWNNIIVSLLHKNNTSKRSNVTENMEPNGWHFDKISDELFLIITSLDSK